MATYVIGDVHGCFETLQRLLSCIEWQREADRVFLTGDLVNGGANSVEVIRWTRDHAAGVVLGNHDLHLLAVEAGARPLRRNDTFRDVLEAPDAKELLQWLRHRPLAVEGDDFFLVHAGILPDWSQSRAKELAADVEAGIQEGNRQFFESMYGNEPSRWSEALLGAERARVVINAMTRMRMLGREGDLDMEHSGPPEEAPAALGPWFQVPRPHGDEKRIFFGHWAALGFRVTSRAVALDSGCAWGGELTAFRVDDNQVFQVRSELEGRELTRR